MPEQRTSTEPRGERQGGVDDRTELQAELDRRNEEILRLRDLLIAKDAELGTARGKLAELAAHSARLIVLAQAVRSRISGIPRRALAVLARLAALRRRG